MCVLSNASVGTIPQRKIAGSWRSTVHPDQVSIRLHRVDMNAEGTVQEPRCEDHRGFRIAAAFLASPSLQGRRMQKPEERPEGGRREGPVRYVLFVPLASEF